MIPIQNTDFINQKMDISFIHPKILWGEIFFKPIPIDFMKPEKGHIVLANLIESRPIKKNDPKSHRTWKNYYD